jgi:hypothetical protein
LRIACRQVPRQPIPIRFSCNQERQRLMTIVLRIACRQVPRQPIPIRFSCNQERQRLMTILGIFGHLANLAMRNAIRKCLRPERYRTRLPLRLPNPRAWSTDRQFLRDDGVIFGNFDNHDAAGGRRHRDRRRAVEAGRRATPPGGVARIEFNSTPRPLPHSGHVVCPRQEPVKAVPTPQDVRRVVVMDGGGVEERGPVQAARGGGKMGDTVRVAGR